MTDRDRPMRVATVSAPRHDEELRDFFRVVRRALLLVVRYIERKYGAD